MYRGVRRPTSDGMLPIPFLLMLAPAATFTMRACLKFFRQMTLELCFVIGTAF